MPVAGGERCDVAFKGWVAARGPPVGGVRETFLDVD